ncbi:UNVERIFIED_CONTAM: hypothetical protein K2H54_061055 [Gekko kuhli]
MESQATELLLQDILNGIGKAIQGSPGVQLSYIGPQLLLGVLNIRFFHVVLPCCQAIGVLINPSRDLAPVLIQPPPPDSGSPQGGSSPPLNYEKKKSYTLNIEGANTHLDFRFSHLGPFKDVTMLKISVGDVDEPPVFTLPSYVMDVHENAKIGTVVGTVTAQDPDSASNEVSLLESFTQMVLASPIDEIMSALSTCLLSGGLCFSQQGVKQLNMVLAMLDCSFVLHFPDSGMTL